MCSTNRSHSLDSFCVYMLTINTYFFCFTYLSLSPPTPSSIAHLIIYSVTNIPPHKQQVFEAELKLFKEENILCALDDCPDNLPCVELLSGKGGILDVLNVQCMSIQPSEDKYVRDLTKEHKSNNFFPSVHRKDAKDNFKVLHFAGPVQYTVAGWLLKNSDPLPESMAQVFSNGSLKLVTRILRDEIAKANEVESDSKAKKVKQSTVSMAFVKSMKSLTEELSLTKCNFIRCIKPNPQMIPNIFNR
jgi:myosin heavy subunit